MALRLILAAVVSAAGVGGCNGTLATVSETDGGPVESTGSDDASFTGDAAAYGSAATPPECAKPGPFTATPPSASAIGSGILGTWVYCDTSLFSGVGDAGAAAPSDGIAIAFRPDESWQGLAASKGELVPLKTTTSTGTWLVYSGTSGGTGTGTPTLEMNRDGAEGVGASPIFSPDGRSVSVTTSVGKVTVMAKAVGTE